MMESIDKDLLVSIGWTPDGAKFIIAKSGKRDMAIMLNRIAKKHSRVPLNVKRLEYKSQNKKQHIPNKIRWDVWERDNFTCQHCGKRRYLSVDHIIPESKGGTLELDNLQTLCKRCNSKKGTK